MTASRRRHERGQAGVLCLQPGIEAVGDQPRLKDGTAVFDVEGGRGGRYCAFVLETLDGGKFKDYQKSAEASGIRLEG